MGDIGYIIGYAIFFSFFIGIIIGSLTEKAINYLKRIEEQETQESEEQTE